MTHLGTKTMETDRLILRPFAEADAQAMFDNWASDPEVTKYLTWPTHSDPRITSMVLRDWVSHYEEDGYYQWAIVSKASGQPIGSIAVVASNDQACWVELGYCIGRNWWHQGIVAEAVKRLIAFFFEEVGVGRIQARHDPRNENSGAVMRKCGMTREGILRRADRNNQGICDVCVYSILREEYDAEQ